MIKKIVYGKPIETFAVVKKVSKVKDTEVLISNKKENGLEFVYKLNAEDIVYGLGETMGRINKRGRRFISFNNDNNNHTDDLESLYSTHNFLIIDGKKHLGLFFDTPAKVTFEIDINNSGLIKVICENPNLNLYIITGESAYDVTKQFLNIIGTSFVPPLWAFGYGQSRWGYKCEKDFNEVIDNYRKNHLPLDYVCMDIDYMDRYINFTVDRERFPNIKGFVENARQNNIHLVPIIDAGIKIEPGNKVYEEGVKNNYFCKSADGKNFEALVWPGLTHFTDFLQSKARVWFGKQYKYLTDLGFEGFWNDMNEPSIFANNFNDYEYKDDSLVALEEKQRLEDYKKFYHKIKGKMINHYDVHNIYGHLMTVAAGEQLRKLINNRYLLFTRSTYIGSHRYGGMWTGDNASTWEQLKLNLLQMPSLNMCGMIYSGADIGGFMKDCNRELMIRWLALAVFTPLMRNHSAVVAKPQELYRFEKVDDFRTILSLRYKLLPYIYSEFMKAVLKRDMFIKPLAFEFTTDDRVKTIEDQLLVGESVMIAPIIEKGKLTRKVYLPEKMTKVKYSSNGFECEELEKGEHTIKAKLNEVVFFIRDNKLVPVCAGGESTAEIDLNATELLGNGSIYEQYIDDGQTKKVSLKNIKILTK